MSRHAPIAVTDRAAADMLSMSRDEFRRLVALGALPQPRKIGPHERWSVELLQSIIRGDLAKPDDGLEL